MSLKSVFSKIIPAKKKTDAPEIDSPGAVIQHEISFDKIETSIETYKPVAEIDVYVNDEKTNIHTLAQENRIGRDPSVSDIIISELIVSKLHCTIYAIGDHYFVRDDNSTNGVFIHDEKVSEVQLHDGDIILLGRKGTAKIVFHKR